VIKSFRDPLTRRLWLSGKSRKFPAALVRHALRKLLMLESAGRLDDLRVPPGNRLEALQSDRQGQFSTRVNDQFRICFDWKDGHAWNVEIVDYH
jgi:proteic killer suppression protein